MDKPGPIADRQNAPHPHQALLDPTGKFILVPDLGADKIYVYAVAEDSLRLTALPPIVVKDGSGPRHVAFAFRDGKTFMYLVTELANTIIGYEVTYPPGGIEFKELFNIGSHGAGKPVSEAVYAAEILVSVSLSKSPLCSRIKETTTRLKKIKIKIKSNKYLLMECVVWVA